MNAWSTLYLGAAQAEGAQRNSVATAEIANKIDECRVGNIGATPSNEGFPSNRRSGPFRVSWRDLVNYALIVGAAEDGGAVEMLAGFVEDYGSGGFGSGALVGEAVQNAVRPFAT